MLFMYIHTHPVEKCLEDKPEEARQIFAGIMQAAQQAGIKLTGTYGAPHEHSMFAIFEADDFAAVSQALRPMLTLGTARIIPILPAEQILAQFWGS